EDRKKRSAEYSALREPSSRGGRRPNPGPRAGRDTGARMGREGRPSRLGVPASAGTTAPGRAVGGRWRRGDEARNAERRNSLRYSALPAAARPRGPPDHGLLTERGGRRRLFSVAQDVEPEEPRSRWRGSGKTTGPGETARCLA